MSDPAAEDGLIYAYALDGSGGATAFGWDELAALIAGPTPVWVHLDRNQERARRWLREASGLDELVVEALLEEDTRPRTTALGTGTLVILRGVNLNPGSDPEDMVSLRLWFDQTTVVSARLRRSMALQELPTELASSQGPASCPELVAEIVGRLSDRIGPVVGELEDEVDDLEDQLLGESTRELRASLASLPRQAIALRRYVAPQRDALRALAASASAPWTQPLRARIQEIADRVTRYVEDLDAIRERAAITQDQLTNHISEEMNRTMYLLSIVAALFLPLGFLTGLLGINVGGIPGSDNPAAFGIFVLLLIGIVFVQLVVFRILKLL